ncbi:phage T7 F exclusion suppressor FxsA [Nocardioides dokdonensis FR1436]|uniref:Phage T7 F exclusion suppressor FxsA n=1 Tax=Nocardioides dokdonensis FR1436 TaxID=1300347 RepID=A0A1A9GPV9_9ACTN|nr:FxsA family protein [Nocardioides dokdonensis]ANH39700.1 phage T7 F exclusion suppressor FxsA [Nocardioides dokdonensis FR1436]
MSQSAGAAGRAPRRRGGLGWVLLVLFVGLPLLELYMVIQVGQLIGAGWTILLLVVDSVLGAFVVRREGARAWRALRDTLARGGVPAKELADGGLVLVGGTLLLTPGFVTDALGALLVLPVTRPLFRGLLTRMVAARLVPVTIRRWPGAPGGSGDAHRPGPGSGPVVRGDVVDGPDDSSD